MPGFLYYCSEWGRDITTQELCAAGLRYVFGDSGDAAAPSPAICGVRGGPDDKTGVLVADDSAGQFTELRVGYYSDQQTWRRIPTTEIWCGLYTATPPTPQNLLRAKPLQGHLVRLGDGHEWLVPIARGMGEGDAGFGWYIALPTHMNYNAEGEWVRGDIKPQYRELWETGEQWAKAFLAALPTDEQPEDHDACRKEIKYSDMAKSAAIALAGNYRIGPTEIDMLRLFDNDNMVRVLNALIDWPTWEELQKKTAQAIGDSNDGSPADSTAIAPQ